LRFIFALQGSKDIFINRALGDDMVDDDRISLALTPESGVGLLVKFQAPS
jgi:hypothetical protein